MISRITSALTSRRNALGDKEKGFTLIELLVVVIIIGILAAIAIPVYMGIQNNAKDSATQSDLTNWKTQVVAAQTDNNGDLPTTTPAFIADNDTSTATSYAVVGTGFCIQATSKANNTFSITDSTAVAEQPCGGSTPTTP